MASETLKRSEAKVCENKSVLNLFLAFNTNIAERNLRIYYPKVDII